MERTKYEKGYFLDNFTFCRLLSKCHQLNKNELKCRPNLSSFINENVFEIFGSSSF
jgi:hypothetical protein